MIYNAIFEWLSTLAPDVEMAITQFYAVALTLGVCFLPVWAVKRWFS